ncbi:MAG: type II secretion system protein GspG [Planctomycetota bacterium]
MTAPSDETLMALCAAGELTPEQVATRALDRSRALQARARRWRWLALGGLLLAALGVGISVAHELGEKALAQRDLWRLEHAIQRIQNVEGRYPASEEELLRALSRHPDPGLRRDAEGRPLDHWGHPYRYRYPGVEVPGQFDLWSPGANGVDEGGQPDDQTNWR